MHLSSWIIVSVVLFPNYVVTSIRSTVRLIFFLSLQYYKTITYFLLETISSDYRQVFLVHSSVFVLFLYSPPLDILNYDHDLKDCPVHTVRLALTFVPSAKLLLRLTFF